MPNLTIAAGKCILALALISAFAVYGQQAVEAESESGPGDYETVFIHGGSADGFYNRLIKNQLNDPLINIPYHFEVACDKGGSIPNLERLGMRQREGYIVDGSETGTEKGSTSESESTTETAGSVCLDTAANSVKFALVQNYWIYAAKDDICDSDGANECPGRYRPLSMAKYEPFTPLRIVLPVSYGHIQIISTANVLADRRSLKASEDAPEEPILRFANSRVFVGVGVNKQYGKEVFREHPLLTAVRQIETADEITDEEIKAAVKTRLTKLRELNDGKAPTDTEIEDEEEDVRKFVNNLPDAQRQLGNGLLACGLVDAYMISGEIVEPSLIDESEWPETCRFGSPLRQVPVPEVIVDTLVAEYPYYQKLRAPDVLSDKDDGDESKFDDPMLAVTSYLVATADYPVWADRQNWGRADWWVWLKWQLGGRIPDDVERVRAITKELERNWSKLMLINRHLAPLEENVHKRPAVYHAGAELALQQAELIGGGTRYLPLVILGLLLVPVVFVVITRVGQTVGFDRMGEREYRIHQSFSRFGKDLVTIVLIFVAAGAAFYLVVSGIRFLEFQQASSGGFDDPISQSKFQDVLLWMFTFVSSGYEADIFPRSTLSVVLVSVFALFGIALPIWLLVTYVDGMRERRKNLARGGDVRGIIRRAVDGIIGRIPWSYRSQGILLVCGWSNKGPGLIYTLTCKDSPYYGMINIVADMGVEYPIDHWRFNKRRVRFYRGDASHRRTLERAEARRADSALILADEVAATRADSSGVLAALALERLDSGILVSAEMSLTGEDRDFSQQHLHRIVDPRVITRRMLATACLNEHVLDFVLDALSPGRHYEWYSRSSRGLRSRFLRNRRGKKLTVADYAKALQQHGIHVIGLRKRGSDQQSGEFATGYKRIRPDMLHSYERLQDVVEDDTYIICAAERPRTFRPSMPRKLINGLRTPIETEHQAESILPALPHRLAVLIIGGEAQSRTFGEFLETLFDGITVGRVTTNDISANELNQEISSIVAGDDWTHVVLLSSVPKVHSSSAYARLALRADSDTILRANTIQMALDGRKDKPVIIAEVNNTRSRQLASDAGAQTAVPSSLLVERILARVVTGRGYVSETLSYLLDGSRGSTLRSVKLHEDHPLIGMRVDVAMNTWFADGRVVGVLPMSAKSEYRNVTDDFDYHFIMCPSDSEARHLLSKDDVIIVLAFAGYKVS